MSFSEKLLYKKNFWNYWNNWRVVAMNTIENEIEIWQVGGNFYAANQTCDKCFLFDWEILGSEIFIQSNELLHFFRRFNIRFYGLERLGNSKLPYNHFMFKFIFKLSDYPSSNFFIDFTHVRDISKDSTLRYVEVLNLFINLFKIQT